MDTDVNNVTQYFNIMSMIFFLRSNFSLRHVIHVAEYRRGIPAQVYLSGIPVQARAHAHYAKPDA